MNITEDYISFEVAKLLKEKGFDWDWSPFYSEQDRDEWARNNNYNIPNPNYDANIPFDSEILNVIAPHVSLQMAMKWLREVHNICISVDIKIGGGKYYVCISSTENGLSHGVLEDEVWDTFEKACNAAIKYCLENFV